MSTTITDTHMTSEDTHHSAHDTETGTWVVSWLPERRLDRNQAVTAMTIAATVAAAHGDPTGKDLLLVTTLAAELDLTGDDAIRQCTR